ncbi:uncharacterized protein LOC103977263 [Musa acuminata AAA Group]|uniref:uncharacterized protein LOC103977263 n=1 Tax=Musa acuminata AAA Group TaxID=214697 RepID=UPI0031CE18D3
MVGAGERTTAGHRSESRWNQATEAKGNTAPTGEREREGEMAWWNKKVVFPVKRALVAVAARVKARKHGDGISKLHDDVQTCGYQDVQVMWEMLRRSETELPKQRKRRFWRPSASSRRTTSCDSMERASSSPR